MHLVPIPNTEEATAKSFPVWFPFLAGIAKRSKEPVDSLLGQIARREVQLALIWDGERAHALVGIRLVKRGDDLIGEIIWTTGKGMREWFPLVDELERYLKDIGCAEIRPICRLGWSRLLKKRGYRATHVTMEKPL